MSYVSRRQEILDSFRKECLHLHKIDCPNMVYVLNDRTLYTIKDHLGLLPIDREADAELKSIARDTGIHLAFVTGFSSHHVNTASSLDNKIAVIFYWVYGEKEVVYVDNEGDKRALACSAANSLGLGAGALHALDFYHIGWTTDYVWDTNRYVWINKTQKDFA